MEIGYSRPAPPDAVPDMILQATAQGYGGLQLKGGQYAPWLGDIDAFRKRFDVSQIMGIIAYGSDEGNLRSCIDFAGELQLAAVTWVPGWKRDQVNEEAYKSAAGFLNRLGKYAQEKKTRLSVHNHAGMLFQDAVDLSEFRRFVQPEHAGLTLDTAHLALGGVTDVAGVIRECKGYIDLFHIKDLRGRKFCNLGDGELDFDSIFKAVEDIGFDGWLVVDDESDQMSLEDALPHAMSFMRRYR
jgi:sugar phosphate isomerase/epimerase